MEQRVFRIDQECFIVFAESLSSKKERFLRIGNSDFLKDFGERLTFLSLVTPLYPGNPFKELEIFRPDIDRRLIGLQSVVDKFMTFLENGNVDIGKLKSVYAESQGDTGTTRKTEQEFLESIRTDRNRKNHAFASFYNDGNIRIFDRNEVFFDLKERMSEIRHERNELEKMSGFFQSSYESCYEKSGFIISGKSMFVFSNGRFACFSDSSQWVREAIRAGINPADVEFLYLTRGVEPDSLWLKTFLKKWENDQKIKLVLRDDKPNWLHLIPDELYIPLYPEKDTIDSHLGKVRMLIQNKRITIIFDKMKLVFDGEAGFLNPGSVMEGEIIPQKTKKTFSLIIEDIIDTSLTVYKYNPVIFSSGSLSTRSVKEFWKGYPRELPSRITNKIQDYDKEYANDYVPPFNKDPDFMARLFVETVRRIHWEGIKKHTSNSTYIHFKRCLENLDGKSINQNRIIMEQHLGLCKNRTVVGIRDVMVQHSIPDIDEDDNPYLFFQKEYNLAEIKEKHDAFKVAEEREKNAEDLIASIEHRFDEIIEDKTFFEQERGKLLEFIEEIETQERLETELLQSGDQAFTNVADDTGQETINDDTPMDETIPVGDAVSAEESVALTGTLKNEDGTTVVKSTGSGSDKRTLVAVLMGALLVALILIGSGINLLRPDIIWYPLRDFIMSRDDGVTQDEYLEDIEERYDGTNVPDTSKSTWYRFYMTIMDNIDLTNKICSINGFHRMAADWEKGYGSNLKGMDPDWIYPGNIITMPDESKVTIRRGDTMWGICEKYLLAQINEHEIEIRDIIMKVKTGELTDSQAKLRFQTIKEESYSEMVRDVVDVLIKQTTFKKWEPYMEQYIK
jgi:hypothetical protein